MSDTSGEQPKVYKANYMLQQKVGTGPIDEALIKQSQTVIDENQVDFTPLGLKFLDSLQKGIEIARDPATDLTKKKKALTSPVMELKANASIFHYTLIGNLANIMLSFLESITKLDKDAVEIVQAHHKTLHLIITKKMSGDGGQYGSAMISELKNACARYYAKQKKS